MSKLPEPIKDNTGPTVSMTRAEFHALLEAHEGAGVESSFAQILAERVAAHGEG